MSSFDLVLLFSPQNCSLELLTANLTSKRRELAANVVARIKDATKQHAGRYDLLIGPRGTGKTHILAYVEQVLRRDIGDELRIVHLSEEEFGIGTMLDFLVACLQAAQVPLDPLYDDLRGPKAQETAERAFLAYLDTTPGLLVVENFALVLDGMDTDEQRRFRTFLQNNPQISVLASSPWLFGDSDKPDHPFHGFFLIEPLEALTRVQAREYLIQLAEWKGDEDLVKELRTETAQARVNAIYDLTGGNHRLLGMLSECLRADDLQTLVEPFVRLVDRELTPYYQQRLGRLPAQPNKILKTLARQQGAIPVKDIARLCFITEQTASGQLRVLKEAGLVRSEQLGRESFYELQEPLLRFVLDIKEGRERLLPSLVALLREWYSLEELYDFAVQHNGYTRNYFLQAVYEKLQREGAVLSRNNQEVESFEGATSERLPDLMTYFRKLAKQRHESKDYLAEVKMHELIDRHFSSNPSKAVSIRVAEALVDKGIALALAQKGIDALAAFKEVTERYVNAEDAEIQEQVIWALLLSAGILEYSANLDEVVSIYDEVVTRSENNSGGATEAQVAWAMLNKAHVLYKLGNPEEAMALYEEVNERYGARRETYFVVDVARALAGKANVLSYLGKHEEALNLYESIKRTYGTCEDARLSEVVASALLSSADILSGVPHNELALSACEEVEQRYGDRQESTLQVLVSEALFKKGMQLRLLDRNEEALAVFEGLTVRCQERKVPVHKRFTVMTELMRGRTLRTMGRWDAAASVYKSIDFATIRPDANILPKFIADVIDVCRYDLDALASVTRNWANAEETLAGLTYWVRTALPLTEDEAKSFQTVEANFRQVFHEVPGADPVIELFSAARAYSLGEKKALLHLPLEARRLVERAYGIEKAE